METFDIIIVTYFIDLDDLRVRKIKQKLRIFKVLHEKNANQKRIARFGSRSRTEFTFRLFLFHMTAWIIHWNFLFHAVLLEGITFDISGIFPFLFIVKWFLSKTNLLSGIEYVPKWFHHKLISNVMKWRYQNFLRFSIS